MTDMQVSVNVDFFQYYLSDALGGADVSRADDTADGIIGPVDTAMRIQTGMQHGLMRVTLDFRQSAPPPPDPDALAAEADISLPTGTINVQTFDGLVAARHDFPGCDLARVRVEVIDRYELDPDGSPAEQHKITIWPVNAPTPRWRSG
jgi:hypothetical protein